MFETLIHDPAWITTHSIQLFENQDPRAVEQPADSGAPPEEDLPRCADGSMDVVTEASEESFPASDPKSERRRDYETVGFVIRGRAELTVEGQLVHLEEGDSWVVPRGAAHAYHILEPFTAVEATYPPSHVHGRDK